MSSHEFSRAITVMKIGGSILTGPISYRQAAHYLQQRLAADPDEKFVVVVSAQNGTTDSLLREAQAIVEPPAPAALDLLWSTGEMRSAALMAIHLQALSVPSEALNIHETGLYFRRGENESASVAVDTERIRQALTRCGVVIVPGFLATNPLGKIVSLGRGSSDLTAVLLAAALEARRCELIKDVPGYFSSDPHRDRKVSHLPQLSFAKAMAMAEAGCDLVQRQALEAAEKFNMPVVVRTLSRNARESWVTNEPKTAEPQTAQATI